MLDLTLSLLELLQSDFELDNIYPILYWIYIIINKAARRLQNVPVVCFKLTNLHTLWYIFSPTRWQCVHATQINLTVSTTGRYRRKNIICMHSRMQIIVGIHFEKCGIICLMHVFYHMYLIV